MPPIIRQDYLAFYHWKTYFVYLRFSFLFFLLIIKRKDVNTMTIIDTDVLKKELIEVYINRAGKEV